MNAAWVQVAIWIPIVTAVAIAVCYDHRPRRRRRDLEVFLFRDAKELSAWLDQHIPERPGDFTQWEAEHRHWSRKEGRP